MSENIAIFLMILGIWAVVFLLVRRRWPLEQATEQQPTHSPPEPTARRVSLECETVAMFSPAYHNEKGWPAIAIEMLPPCGNVVVERVAFFEHVRATYCGPGLADCTIEEVVPSGCDIELLSVGDEVSVNCPTPRCKVVMGIHKTVLERARQGLPEGYDPTPTCVTVSIGMRLDGKAIAGR